MTIPAEDWTEDLTEDSTEDWAAPTAFQAATRAADLPMAAQIPVEESLQPVIAELRALIDRTPEAARGHTCPDGSWSTIELMASDSDGAARWLVDPTELPALRKLFDDLGGDVRLAVLARLAPDDVLDWHRDPCAADMDIARLHLPVLSNPDAVTDLCHERVHWPVGGLHYGDYGFPHRVINKGAEGRVHLYFDLPAAAVLNRLPAVFGENVDARRRLRQEAVNLMLRDRALGHGPIA